MGQKLGRGAEKPPSFQSGVSLAVAVFALSVAGCGQETVESAIDFDFNESEPREISQDCIYFVPIYETFWAKYRAAESETYPEVIALAEANSEAQRVFMQFVINGASLTDETLKSIIREISMPFVDYETGLSYLISGMGYCGLEQLP